MKNRFSRQRATCGHETLESRAMFASLSGMNVGAACPAFASSDTSQTSLVSTSSVKNTTKPEYTYSFSGNSSDKVVAPISGGLALMGGGTQVDGAFKWLADKANGGDFVVLGASSTNFYDKYVSSLSTLDSVETLIIPTVNAANADFVYDKIAHAEAIFIKGGDQSDYILNWSGTRVEEALYTALKRHVPIGGSSAGLAVLGDVDFSAVNDSVTSAEALANPRDPSVTLDTGFLTPTDTGKVGTSLNLLDNAITDTHFMQRDRMGRLMTFMARMDADNLVPKLPRGIAVNEETALLVSEDGSARVVGNSYSKKLSPSEQQRSVYLAVGAASPSVTGAPLNYSVHVQRANYDPDSGMSTSVNLASWTVDGVPTYDVSAQAGVLSSSSGSIYG